MTFLCIVKHDFVDPLFGRAQVSPIILLQQLFFQALFDCSKDLSFAHVEEFGYF